MRAESFESGARVQMAERLLGSVDSEKFGPALLGSLNELVTAGRGLLYAVQRSGPPDLLFDQLASHADQRRETRADLVDGFLLGLYHGAFLSAAPAGFFTDEDVAGSVSKGEDVRRVAFLARVSDSACLALLILRDSACSSFSAAELNCCRGVQGVICTALRLHWRSYAASRAMSCRSFAAPGLQERVEAALDCFGSQLLTRREGEVVRLLLRGSSTKAAAARLGIATATAALHRKRAYAKLGVRSQAQLFYGFICSLSGDGTVGVPFPSGQDSWPRVASAAP